MRKEITYDNLDLPEYRLIVEKRKDQKEGKISKSQNKKSLFYKIKNFLRGKNK